MSGYTVDFKLIIILQNQNPSLTTACIHATTLFKHNGTLSETVKCFTPHFLTSYLNKFNLTLQETRAPTRKTLNFMHLTSQKQTHSLVSNGVKWIKPLK